MQDEAEIAAAIDLAVTSFGRLDVMMNNAGAPGGHAALTDIEAADFDRTVAINFRAVWLGIKHAGRRFQEQAEAGSPGGAIINVASAAAFSPLGPAVYASCKAGVLRLTVEGARQLGAIKVRVNSISPGAVPTTMYGVPPAEMAPYLEGAQLLPQVGRPEDIAEAALYLASDAGAFVTGTDLLVDGGLVAGGTARFDAAMNAFAQDRPKAGAA